MNVKIEQIKPDLITFDNIQAHVRYRGVKRTHRIPDLWSANDPKRTYDRLVPAPGRGPATGTSATYSGSGLSGFPSGTEL